MPSIDIGMSDQGNGRMQDLERWLAIIREGNAAFRGEIGSTKLGAFSLASRLLAAPRILGKAVSGDLDRPLSGDLQWPWLPHWPALAATPIHDSRRHAWTAYAKAACRDVREELAGVREAFARARYDSDLNPKQWSTYYFYLHGKAVDEHLSACPRTAEAARQDSSQRPARLLLGHRTRRIASSPHRPDQRQPDGAPWPCELRRCEAVGRGECGGLS